MTQDSLQVDLQDDDLLLEVELTTTLMAAANLTDVPFSVDEIDALLGVGLPALAAPSGAVAPVAPVVVAAPDERVLVAESR